MYQDKLRTFVKNEDHIRNLVAQLIHENGALDPTLTTGDNGCSLGIVQYHVCGHHRVSAKRYLQLHPEWASAEYQLDWMVARVKEKYERYEENIFKTVLAHNCPQCALYNSDSKAGYWQSNLYYITLLSKQ